MSWQGIKFNWTDLELSFIKLNSLTEKNLDKVSKQKRFNHMMEVLWLVWYHRDLWKAVSL